MKADFFIVGQGLAGSLLAYELLKRNKTVLVFDDPSQIKASEVAAGLINPVIFRRMTKSWLADEAIPVMVNTYREIEELLNKQFFYPAQILKILTEETSLLWKNKAFANNLHAYAETEPNSNYFIKELAKTFSVGLINKSGRFDIQRFIYSFREFLEKQNLLVCERFETSKLVINSDFIAYDNFIAQKVIFCEGFAVSTNPFFKNLQFKHSKGEVLDVEIPDFNLDKIIHGEVFVMPLVNNRYRIGATYSWDQLNNEPTLSGEKELLDKFKKIAPLNFKILKHEAGIRPTMHDRKPVIGLLPDHSRIGIFNGLGSKGVLLGPYFANQLADFLTEISNHIHPEADVARYYKIPKKIKRS